MVKRVLQRSDRQVIHLVASAPVKPLPGEPCNGCGVCCAASPCPVARIIFLQWRGPCRALHWSRRERRYHCGLLFTRRSWQHRLPAPVVMMALKLVRRWIAAGTGCDSLTEVEP